MASTDLNRPVVLVVDDEPLLRIYVADIIETAGYHVVEAINADEAMSILLARSDIAFIFTDIEMPGTMNGLELASAVRDRWPLIGLIITSGRYKPQEEDLPPGSWFLEKPLDEPQIKEALRSLAT